VQSRITSAAYFARPNLLPLIACRMIRSSIDEGIAPPTPYALSIYGIVLNTLGMHAEAHSWGQVALGLMERFTDRSLDARTGHVVHDLVCNWTVPLAGTLPDMLEVFETGKASGDLEYGSYAAHAYVHNALYAGVELEPLLELAHEFSEFMRGHGQVNALHLHQPFEQLLRAYTGRTPDPSKLDDEGYSEARALAQAEAVGSRSAMCLIRVVMGFARYNQGSPEGASEAFEAARPYLDGMPSVWHTPMFHQFSALSILGLGDERRAGLMPHVDSSLEALRGFAAANTVNFQHRVELVEAELARVQSDHERALELCAKASASAREYGWRNDEGIALEIAARCHETLGHAEDAARCREEARAVYARWGASAMAARFAR
jgi:tetratricopeptide (TPR) repeat protein